MSVPVQGEVTVRIWSPGVQGPVERTVVISLPRRAVTEPEQLQRLNFESDCKFVVDAWVDAIKASKRELSAGVEATTYTSAVLTEVLGVTE